MSDLLYEKITRAKGVGFVHIVPPAFGDSVVVRVFDDTTQNAAVVAYMIHWTRCQHGWLNVAVQDTSLSTHLARLNAEDYGLLAVDRVHDWVRVAYAWTGAGNPLYGWTKLRKADVEFWKEALAE